MIQPRRAPVRPRVLSPVTGVALPVEEVVGELICRRNRGLIEIVGPCGSGKTTALEHLAAVLPAGGEILFVDCPSFDERKELEGYAGWVVFASAFIDTELRSITALSLAPWGHDDFIEYLLALHKDQCASVMARITASGQKSIPLAGNAGLWSIVLDRMARDEAIRLPGEALEQFLAAVLQDHEAKETAAAGCLTSLVQGSFPSELDKKLRQQKGGEDAAKALRHRPLLILLDKAQILKELHIPGDHDFMRRRLPRDLVVELGKATAEAQDIQAKLQECFVVPENQAMAASILHAAGTGWTPQPDSGLRLAGAYLQGAKWPGIILPEVDLSSADLSGADLQEAKLHGGQARKANLSSANLRNARLADLYASEADLTKADLSGADARNAIFDSADLEQALLAAANLRRSSWVGANLSDAQFSKADLGKAILREAKLTGADFTAANLEHASLEGIKLREACFLHARFAGARLAGCDLEEMELPGADFSQANLKGALLTGSRMTGARFDGAFLQGAGLADVEWEGVCLRDADLRGASFHLGSARSGLVGSPIACEGSRTGFYTDDYEEQDFKSPEEIRKANLCRADLRGARIDDVDFYLVDLRGALFDLEQEPQLRRCGAILKTRG